MYGASRRSWLDLLGVGWKEVCFIYVHEILCTQNSVSFCVHRIQCTQIYVYTEFCVDPTYVEKARLIVSREENEKLLNAFLTRDT